MQDEAFFRAVLAGELDAVRAGLAARPTLVHARADPAWAPDGGADHTALHFAAFCHSAEIESALVAAGADPSAENGEGRTALHVALEYNDTTREHLISLGVPLDVCAAAALERTERLRELLAADPSRANDRKTGLSPLGWTAYFDAARAAELLIAQGARMDDAELLHAASVNAVSTARLLLVSGYPADRFEPAHGGTATHAAAAMRHTLDAEPFLDLLISAGVDVNARTSKGRTPIDVAEAARTAEAARIAAGSDETPRNYGGVITRLELAGGRRAAELD